MEMKRTTPILIKWIGGLENVPYVEISHLKERVNLVLFMAVVNILYVKGVDVLMNKMAKKECVWYCYVCGKVLGKIFSLASMSNSTDRVFLAHTKCSVQIGDSFIMDVEKKSIKYSEEERI